MNPLLTTREAATVLRMHPETVQRWAKAGTLPSVRVGARLRFDRDDLAAFIAARRSRPVGTPAPIPPRQPAPRLDLTPVNPRRREGR